MPLTGGLFACEDPKVWTEVFSIYQDVIRAIGEKQKKLPALDRWYQNELPASVQSRAEKYLTHSELVKLMEWKLTRGKFRPRLQQMVTSNPSELVEACTKKAFQLLPDVTAAITELSQLKAIGPATASVQIPPSTAYAVAPVKRPMEEDIEVKSPIEKKKQIQKKAVLAAGSPETAAFMADEALQSIPGLTPIQYTLKHYLLYLDKICSCARKLNKEDAGAEWSPHRVELCLWAWAMAEKVRPALLENLGTGSAGKSSNGSGEKRPAKKIKTK